MKSESLHILVVEDDFFAADKLSREIRAGGDTVVGPFADVHDAIHRVGLVQAAILDVRVQDETSFQVMPQQVSRFAANYARGADGRPVLLDDPATSRFTQARAIASGGGGLVSTAGDYMRFCHLMLGGGTLDGVRLLGRKTVALMTANHLGGDMASMGQARFSESSYAGIGFGLGFSVMLDPARAQIVGTPGEYAWGGAASTAFWIDPAEELAVILLTQLTPSSTYPIRKELRVLTYAALD